MRRSSSSKTMHADIANGRPVPLSVWAGFAMMCLGMFMAILDIQVVATSLPTIQSALAIAPDEMSWVQTAYLIAEVIAIPLTGLLTRALSMRWLFVAAVSVFTLASVGCASSYDFVSLVAWRIVQGFAGGTLIPAVFSAVFLLFPERSQLIATTIAGVVAVLAPTLGPVVGGWITETYSWHWLFLINIIPGIVAVATAEFLIPGERPEWRHLRHLDRLSLFLLAAALASLETGLKEAPNRGWSSPLVLVLLAATLGAGTLFVRRTCQAHYPLVDLRTLADLRFATGCTLSFLLGIGLFGSVYLMPVFLAFVRGHTALRIGETMLVTGIAQLVTAPSGIPRAPGRLPCPDSVRLCGICGRLRHERLRYTRHRFRRHVLAAGGAGRSDHVLHPAADPVGARPPCAGAGAGCERAVQPHAESGRRDRHRPHRHGALWARSKACGSVADAAPKRRSERRSRRWLAAGTGGCAGRPCARSGKSRLYQFSSEQSCLPASAQRGVGAGGDACSGRARAAITRPSETGLSWRSKIQVDQPLFLRNR
ncbi:MAG TPA: DHA2 family efflux MFS transporter permease subunit [Sphingomicrobium sp.]|nr:DHA2 family efflux MFS transporter permease subunit [Sphingomicrobium sp.]